MLYDSKRLLRLLRAVGARDADRLPTPANPGEGYRAHTPRQFPVKPAYIRRRLLELPSLANSRSCYRRAHPKRTTRRGQRRVGTQLCDVSRATSCLHRRRARCLRAPGTSADRYCVAATTHRRRGAAGGASAPQTRNARQDSRHRRARRRALDRSGRQATSKGQAPPVKQQCS